jgi:hypothetical protein
VKTGRLDKARTVREGMSLSDFIRRELQRAAEQPTREEWLERTKQPKPVPTRKRGADNPRTAGRTVRVLDASIVDCRHAL